MGDNPGLSARVRERYERMFQGTFYRRYVLGGSTKERGISAASSSSTPASVTPWMAA